MADYTNDPQSPGQAKDNFSKVSKELTSLEPSAIVELYEIDVTDLLKDFNLDINFTLTPSILRFHNMQIFRGRSITFGSNTPAPNTYYSYPIMTEGFEVSAAGDIPRPLLTFGALSSMRAAEDEYPNAPFNNLKLAVLHLNNLINAKVTRIRTFLRFLHKTNDFLGIDADTLWDSSTKRPPELTREIYYIQRKSMEDKDTLQFELSSVLDVENFKLPGRTCLAERCPFAYRGEGCCYEYKATSGSDDETEQKEVHGDAQGRMPTKAPAMATGEDTKLTEKVGTITRGSTSLPGYSTANTPTEYDKTSTYARGAAVYIKKDGIRYYFISKGGEDASVGGTNAYHVPAGAIPPDSTYWEVDQCSKSVKGCKLRWSITGGASWDASAKARFAEGYLRFGGFPSLNEKSAQ
jgi:lambda family phage minor tail protein L